MVEEHDLIIIGGGVAGYVGAIKAGQEGMKVDSASFLFDLKNRLTWYPGSLYREARRAWRNLPKRRLHPLKVPAQ